MDSLVGHNLADFPFIEPNGFIKLHPDDTANLQHNQAMTNHPPGVGTKLKKQDFFEDPTLPLQVYIRDQQPEFPLHSHGFDELVIILKGTSMHVIDGQEFPIKAGDVFVIAQNH